MRVLILSNSYAPILGGLQTVCHHLATGLLGKGHTVDIVTNRYPRYLPKKEALDGVSILRLLFLNLSLSHLKNARPDLFLASFWFYPTTLRELDQLMKRSCPEVVNVHYPLSQVPFLMELRQRYKFRLVVSLHGDEILPWVRAKEDNKPLRIILREADAVTACSNWLLEQADSWEPAIRSKGVAIHNGVDLKRFAGRSSFRHPRPYIFAFGRLSYQKGFDLLLQAFARLASQFPDIDLILAGDGEERDPLQVQAQQAGLRERVHFYGRATPEQVVQLLKGSSFVVIPSRWEPFGIVALEAMAAGKPILATNVGGMPELLNRSNQYTLMVSPTVEGLTHGLQGMVETANGQIFSHAQRNETLSDFSWEEVVARYERVFRQYGD